MTTKTLLQAIKSKKPAIIHEGGVPRYVMLDWKTYEKMDEMEDRLRLVEAVNDPKNQKKIPYSQVKKLLHLGKL